MRQIIIILAIFYPVLIFSGTGPIISWIHPSTRVDGTPLLLSELSETRLRCGDISGGPYTRLYQIPAPANTFASTDVLPDGENYCVASSVDTDGQEGPHSPEKSFFIQPTVVTKAVPAAPQFR